MKAAIVSGDRRAPWLSELPADTGLVPLKYSAWINRRKLSESSPGNIAIKYIDISGVDSNGEVKEIQEIFFEDAPSRARRLPQVGDTIVSTVRTYLQAIAYIEEASLDPLLVCSTGFAVVTPLQDVDPKFLYYWLRSPYMVDEICARSVGVGYPAINPPDFSGLPLPLYDRSKQRAIADFLDRKTAAIDALIQKKEQLIALLQEKRQTLITQAVTKGLDPSVPMKDSGIEWLGEIPAHWECLKLAYVCESIQTGPFGSQLHASDYTEDGIPIINPANITAGRVVADSTKTVTVETFARLKRHELQKGDIVFGRRGEMGRCGLVTDHEKGWLCGTGSLRVRLRLERCQPAFVVNFLSTPRIKENLELDSVGSTMDNLNTSILGRVPIALPPRSEQEAIMMQVCQATQKVEQLIRAVVRHIDRLREYRQALISAAVTGKIDVREAV